MNDNNFILNNIEFRCKIYRTIKKDLKYFLGISSGELKNNYLDFSIDNEVVKRIYFSPDIFTVIFHTVIPDKDLDYSWILNVYNSGKRFNTEYYFPNVEQLEVNLYTWSTYLQYNRNLKYRTMEYYL